MSKTAFVFPGQGSQSVGMLASLAEESGLIKATFDEASEAIGVDLWQLSQEGPDALLNRTDNTQPALLAASVAIWRFFLEQGGSKPDVLAGHSLGEYSALTCAGVFGFADAVRLVQARGKYMQDAVPEGVGAMAAIIGLADDGVVKACAESGQGQVVSAVNFNSPGQVVIAGHAEAVARASEAAKAAGAKRALPLPVSVPSHCSLMLPAAEQLKQMLDTMSLYTPEIDVINNVDVAINADVKDIKDALIRQLHCPVRWTETVQHMASIGVGLLLECGPGKVLAGLTKRIDKSLTASAINTPDAVTSVINA